MSFLKKRQKILQEKNKQTIIEEPEKKLEKQEIPKKEQQGEQEQGEQEQPTIVIPLQSEIWACIKLLSSIEQKLAELNEKFDKIMQEQEQDENTY